MIFIQSAEIGVLVSDFVGNFLEKRDSDKENSINKKIEKIFKRSYLLAVKIVAGFFQRYGYQRCNEYLY
jgi:hypothetical protein